MTTIAQLTAYVLAAIVYWSPHGSDAARLVPIAEDISVVSLEQDPLFKGDDTRAKTALLLASVARFESNFADWVDDGRCNDASWRRSVQGQHFVLRTGDCDGGHAFSLWQIHPYAGASGREMIANRRVAIREAVARLRVSLDAGRGLCGYTGEVGTCPKANLRLRTALVWEKGHPWSDVVAKLDN